MKSNSFMDREFKISEALGKILRISHPALPKPANEDARQKQTAKTPAPPPTSNTDAQ